MADLDTFQRRQCATELMDDPSIDPATHREALNDLARINRLSFSAAILWSALRRLRPAGSANAISVLDLATGGGDVPIQLWRNAKREKLPFVWHACDISSTALSMGRVNAERVGADVEFFRNDTLREPLKRQYDVVMCSLFLHHLSGSEAVCVLRRMKESASRLVLVNDLERSRPGFALAWLGTRLLSRSHVVRYDGPVSVRAAFSTGEARSLAERAGLTHISVKRRWPFRFLLAGKPS